MRHGSLTLLIIVIIMCLGNSVSHSDKPINNISGNASNSSVADYGTDSSFLPVNNHLTFDLSFIMLSMSYARRVNGSWLIGGGAGVGGPFGKMLIAGSHYSENHGFAYEIKDGYTDKSLFDMLHVKLLARYEPSQRWQIDSGIQASAFLHWDSSDDDPGSGFFVGAYFNPMFGWRIIKLGPRLLIGNFSGCGDANEFGIYLSPLIGRATIQW
jgi:hypothetical protein